LLPPSWSVTDLCNFLTEIHALKIQPCIHKIAAKHSVDVGVVQRIKAAL
jgi:hypothetical protein